MTTQDFVTLVRNQVASIQGAAKYLVDLSVGSILRSVAEANSGIVLWLQGLILQVLARTRAATSSGADLDSFVADYGLSRLAAVAATGSVTFSRFTPSLQAVIPVGATVQTADGSQDFAVSSDTTNPAYNDSLGGYVLLAGVQSVTVSVVAATSGSGGNVSAGQISTITQATSGVDTVTNAASFTNGADAEGDGALRSRFVAYIASLAKATKGSIDFAVTSLLSTAKYKLVENYQYNGTLDYGYFYIVVDDGTGHPGSTFLTNVANAIEAVRGFSIRFGVFAPVVVTANVGMTITTAAGVDHAHVVALVVSALQTYINSLSLGQSLTYSRLAQVAYDASSGITNVTGITINGGSSDLAATSQQVIKAGTLTVA